MQTADNTNSGGESGHIDSGLACFAALIGFLGKAVDPEQLKHDLGIGSTPAGAADILRAAKLLSIKAKSAQVSAISLGKQPLPAIAPLKSGAFVIVLQATDSKVLIFNPAEPQPKTIDVETFSEIFSGELLLFTLRDNASAGAKTFDVTWFIPAIIKYRHLLRDVLIASFFLQILGLITPLFFQVVIDKVLVHKGLTTLEILAIGLLCVSLFEVLIGALRTYLF
eukprot:gene30193-38902_t